LFDGSWFVVTASQSWVCHDPRSNRDGKCSMNRIYHTKLTSHSLISSQSWSNQESPRCLLHHHLASELLRTRNSVCLSYTLLAQRVHPINDYRHTFVRISSDSRISSLVCARERDETRWSSASATCNLELMAALDCISELSCMSYAFEFTYSHTGIRCRNSWTYLVHLLYLYLIAQGKFKIINVCGHLVMEWFSLRSGGHYLIMLGTGRRGSFSLAVARSIRSFASSSCKADGNYDYKV
jgi:hypothetical protein